MQNNKKYWLRGGMIVLILDILIVFLFEGSNTGLGLNVVISHDINMILFYLSLIPWFIFQFTMIGQDHISTALESIFLITNFVTYFILGAFVGYLYGKIKNRNRGV